MGVIVLIPIVIIVLFLKSCFIMVPRASAFVMERMGRPLGVWAEGIHVKIPLADRPVMKVSLREQVLDCAPQPVITQDDITLRIDSALYFQITDPKKFCYCGSSPMAELEKKMVSVLRETVGNMTMEETMLGKDAINQKICVFLDLTVKPIGVQVNRVELKNVLAPKEIRD